MNFMICFSSFVKYLCIFLYNIEIGEFRSII